MTEPPRPPGDGSYGAPPPDPTAPKPPSAPYSSPGEPPAPGYAPPPTSGPPYSPPPAGAYQPPGGYQSPPGGVYPSGGGYQPGPGSIPPGYSSNDDKTWALISHFGGALGMFIGGGTLGFVAPLIAYLAKGQQSPAVRAHAVSALNFQLTWSIAAVIGYVLGACGSIIIIGAVLFIIPVAATILGIIFGIIAGIKANEGQTYRYPMSINIIK